jgi:hypothetical protein
MKAQKLLARGPPGRAEIATAGVMMNCTTAGSGFFTSLGVRNRRAPAPRRPVEATS